METRIPKKDEIYKHYKGGIYKIIDVGKHTETEEQMVIYSDNKHNVWVRPLQMWNTPVLHPTSGTEMPRFELLTVREQNEKMKEYFEYKIIEEN